MPLIWDCHIFCVFYNLSLLAHQVLDRVLSDLAPCIYFFTNSLVVLIIHLYINTTRGTICYQFISYHFSFLNFYGLMVIFTTFIQSLIYYHIVMIGGGGYVVKTYPSIDPIVAPPI